MSASMVTTCRKSATGTGAYEFDLSGRCDMTDAESELTILALNSGSSSLKFGLYRVGSARTEVLLSGAAESIGDKEGKFFAQDSRNNASVSETKCWLCGARKNLSILHSSLHEARFVSSGAIRQSFGPHLFMSAKKSFNSSLARFVSSGAIRQSFGPHL
jgi:hypothetical protein